MTPLIRRPELWVPPGLVAAGRIPELPSSGDRRIPTPPTGGGSGGGGADTALFPQVYTIPESAPISDSDSIYDSHSVDDSTGWMTIELTRGTTNHGANIHQGAYWNMGALKDMAGTELTELEPGGCVVIGLQIRNEENFRGMVVTALLSESNALGSAVLTAGGSLYVEASSGDPIFAQIRQRTTLHAGTSPAQDSGRRAMYIMTNGASSISNQHISQYTGANVCTGAAEYATSILSGHDLDRLMLVVSQIGSAGGGSRTLECRVTASVFAGSSTFFENIGA